MSFLTDDKLAALLTADSTVVANFPPAVAKATAHAPFERGSAIQPCSIDLHIGSVMVPGKDGKAKQKSSHALRPGMSAIILSHERLKVPPTHGGIVLPLGGYQQGLLLTNPGHIDPGYEGRLWFIVVNISRETISLSPERRIATLLLFSLDGAPKADWQSRYGPTKYDLPPDAVVEAVAGDCLMVGPRAARVAKKYLAFASVLAAAVTATILFLNSQVGPASDLKASVAVVKRDVEVLSSQVGPVSELKTAMAVLKRDVDNLRPSDRTKELGDAVTAMNQRLEALEKRLVAPVTPAAPNPGSNTPKSP